MKVTLFSGSGESELSPDVLDRPIAPTIRRVDLPDGNVLLIRMVAEEKPATTETVRDDHAAMLTPKPSGQSVSVFSPNMGRAEYADMINVSSILGCQTYHDHAMDMLLRDPRLGRYRKLVSRKLCE